jgi:hypothetical protein
MLRSAVGLLAFPGSPLAASVGYVRTGAHLPASEILNDHPRASVASNSTGCGSFELMKAVTQIFQTILQGAKLQNSEAYTSSCHPHDCGFQAAPRAKDDRSGYHRRRSEHFRKPEDPTPTATETPQVSAPRVGEPCANLKEINDRR